MRRVRLVQWMGSSLLVLLAGCASSGRSVADLEAQVRTLRSSQEQYVQRIQQLETRLAAAGREARSGDTVVGPNRHTVRIVDDGAHTVAQGAVEDIPSALHEDWPDTEQASDEDPSRPTVRAQGRPIAAPLPGTPIVVREDERLPVAPLPSTDRGANPSPSTTPPASRPAASPDSAPRDSGRGPSAMGPERNAVPLGTNAANAHATLGESTSSVRDPRSTAAYDAALADARGGQCARAIEGLASFLVRWPDHPHAASAMYWRGECLLATGDARRAIEQFEGALARSSSAHLSSGALFKLAQSHRRAGDAARARVFADRLQREFPTSDAAARARAEENR